MRITMVNDFLDNSCLPGGKHFKRYKATKNSKRRYAPLVLAQILASLGLLCSLLAVFLLAGNLSLAQVQKSSRNVSGNNKGSATLLLFTNYYEFALAPFLVKMVHAMNKRPIIIGFANFDTDWRILELIKRIDTTVRIQIDLQGSDASIMEQLTFLFSENSPSEVILQPGSRIGLLASLIFTREQKRVIVIRTQQRYDDTNTKLQNEYSMMQRLTQQMCSVCLTSTQQDVGALVSQGVPHHRVHNLGSLYSSSFCNISFINNKMHSFRTRVFLVEWRVEVFASSLKLLTMNEQFPSSRDWCIFVFKDPLNAQIKNQLQHAGHQAITVSSITEYFNWLAVSTAVFGYNNASESSLRNMCGDMGIPFLTPDDIYTIEHKSTFFAETAKTKLIKYDSNAIERCQEAQKRIKVFKRILSEPNISQVEHVKTRKDAIEIAFTSEMRHDKTYVNNKGSIAVILSVFKRDTLAEQLECIYRQSMPANLIFVVQDENHVDISAIMRHFPKVHYIHSSYNFRYHHRFSIGLLLPVEFVAIIDDDMLPQSMWLWNSVRCVKQNNGVCGAIGRSPEQGIKFGDFDEPVESDRKATFVGHAWTFRREWLYDFFSEAPLTFYTSEDHQFSGFLRLKKGIQSYVAMQPANNRSLWPDDPARSWHIHMDEVASYLDPWRDKWRESVSKFFLLMG